MAVLVVVATAFVVETVRSEGCWTPSDATLRLAEEPARAAAALDPGEASEVPSSRTAPDTDPSDTRVGRLLAKERRATCEGPAASHVVGRALLAATTGSDKAASRPERHTEPQARTATAVLLALGERAEPSVDEEFAPYVAKLLAHYAGSLGMGADSALEGHDSALTFPDETTGEPRANLTQDGAAGAAGKAVRSVAPYPESYALLHDTFRAQAAELLDARPRSETRGPKPSRTPSRLALGLSPALHNLAVLQDAYVQAVLDDRVEDRARFDRQVLRHSRGGHGPARAPEESLDAGPAHRRPTDDVRAWLHEGAPAARTERQRTEWFLDGGRQVQRTATLWGERRGLPEQFLNRLRAALSRDWSMQTAPYARTVLPPGS